MDSRLKVAGHAVHPMLIPLPLGMFVGTLIFDVVHLVTDDLQFATVSVFMAVLAVVGGVAAAATGAVDRKKNIPKGTRAKRVGNVHAIGNDVVIGLFAVSAFLRYRADGYDPSALALALTFAGAAISFVTGWLGGELVERLGVGVDNDAHLDATSSLKDEPRLRVQLNNSTEREGERLGADKFAMTPARLPALTGAVALALTLPGCASQDSSTEAGAAAPQVQPGATLLGSVGSADAPEDYEIALTTQDGQAVEVLAAGSYTLVVEDYAQTHNFHLTGADVDVMTDVSATGRRSFDVTFRAGEYEYICDPHPSMSGAVDIV